MQTQPSERHDRIERALRTWVAWGVLAVLLIPAARAQTTWLGWLPLWLVAMPAVAWWALHRFALPRWPAGAEAGLRRRRRRAPQARRRAERTPVFNRRLRAA